MFLGHPVQNTNTSLKGTMTNLSQFGKYQIYYFNIFVLGQGLL